MDTSLPAPAALHDKIKRLANIVGEIEILVSTYEQTCRSSGGWADFKMFYVVKYGSGFAVGSSIEGAVDNALNKNLAK